MSKLLNKYLKLHIFLFFIILGSQEGNAASISVLKWKKVATYPHDPTAYTQGLVYWEPGILAESTGRNGLSTIRRVELKTGKVLDQSPIESKYFGEGLAKIGPNFFQLTWQNGTAFNWRWSKKAGFEKKAEFSYQGEGWGLASGRNGKLLMSNGSSEITTLDPKTFKSTSSVSVKVGTSKQDQINELEFVNGKIFANQWQTSLILRIDPDTGSVDGILDIKDLVPAGVLEKNLDAVANGIAWNPIKKVFYITGKLWPSLYEIKVDGY